MHPTLDSLADHVVVSGDLARDAATFLHTQGKPHTAEHSGAVAGVARNLAQRLALPAEAAFAAGWLHDIAAVIPTTSRLRAALDLGLEVLPEERTHPMILHQKLSAAIARELFGVEDHGILSAIGCHTTLRPGASPLDMLVFCADKIAWDQPGTPPYRDALLAALQESLSAASLVYLTYLWQRREVLPVVHPWMAAAYRELACRP